MNYVSLIINGTEYKLRLTTRVCIALEKQLGYNPLQLFMAIEAGELPKLTDMLIIFNAMLQPLNHGINIDKVYDIFDDYCAEGHNMFDLVPVFIDVFKAGGFINAGGEEDKVKNA